MIFERVMGVIRLDPNTYEAIEHDPAATTQAAIVVALVALARALGSGMLGVLSGSGWWTNFFGALVWTFLGWFAAALISFFIGTLVFGGRATTLEMLRVMGFAFAPQALAVIPCVGALFGFVWSMATAFVAIRQGLDQDDFRALFTMVASLGVYVVIAGALDVLLSRLFLLLG